MSEVLEVRAVDIQVACRVPSVKDVVYIICEFNPPVLVLGNGQHPPAGDCCTRFSLEPQKNGTVTIQNIQAPGEGTIVQIVGTKEAFTQKSKKGVVYALVYHGGEPGFWLGNGKDVIVDCKLLTIERSDDGLSVRVQGGNKNES